MTPNLLHTSPLSAIFVKSSPHSETLLCPSSELSIAPTPTTFTELFAATTVGASLRHVVQFGDQNHKRMSCPKPFSDSEKLSVELESLRFNQRSEPSIRSPSVVRATKSNSEGISISATVVVEGISVTTGMLEVVGVPDSPTIELEQLEMSIESPNIK